MRRILFALLTAVAACAALPVRAADLSIMPVAVTLGRTNDRATVHLMNNGSEPVTMQAEAIAWHRFDGVDADAPTGDLIVNPPVFTVQPGKSQVLRVGLRRSVEADKETTYRMVLREVPSLQWADGLGVSGSVRVLVALRVPVYVAPRQVQRSERWVARRESNGDVVAQVSNAGNVHMKIDRLRLHATEEAGAPMAEQMVGAVLFPGESRSFRLQRAPASGTAPTRLEVMTDRGPQHVALADTLD